MKETIIRGMIHLGLYWPLWSLNVWILKRGLYGLWSSLGKLVFYVNTFYMIINWGLIAKGKSEVDRDSVKLSLFIISCFILMELSTWIYVLQNGVS